MQPIIFAHFIGMLFIMCSAERILSRDKRFLLVYPRNGGVKIVFGFAMPIPLGRLQSLSIGWNLQFQYTTAQNITQLETYPPIVARGRRKRALFVNDRALIYRTLETLLDGEGLNGRHCLLESICENAFQSTQHEVNGLYGELIHMLLTSDYSGSGEIEPDLDPVYLEAQRAGEFGIECKSLYNGCKHQNGLLGLFSTVEGS